MLKQYKVLKMFFKYSFSIPLARSIAYTYVRVQTWRRNERENGGEKIATVYSSTSIEARSLFFSNQIAARMVI